MKKIELLAMLGESKDIIDYLQRKGTVQVEKCDAPESMYYTDTDSSVSQLERLLQTAENARETISFYSPEKKKLTDSFLPRKEVELSDFYEESEKTDVAMAKCREIIDIKKEIADKKADIIREQTAREALIPWERLDIPPNTTGTRHTEVFVGSLPDECTEEALKAGFAAGLNRYRLRGRFLFKYAEHNRCHLFEKGLKASIRLSAKSEFCESVGRR